MEGGIAIFLLVVIAIVATVLAVALYLTGGALWLGEAVSKRETEKRPIYKRVDQPEHERVHFAGTPSGEQAERESR